MNNTQPYKWKEEEIEYLKKNYQTKTFKQLAEELKVNTNQIQYCLRRCNLKKNRHFTREEKQFILDNYKYMTYKELAEKLNITKATLQQYLYNQNLTKKQWTEEEIDIIKSYTIQKSKEILKNRSIKAITCKRGKLNIPTHFREYIKEDYNINLKETEWSYIAGLIDGEGSIYINNRKKYLQPAIIISNTNIEVMGWLKEKLNANFYKNSENKGNRVPGYVCIVSAGFGKCNYILKKIKPYLVIKWRQAKLMEKLIEARLKQTVKETYSEEIKELAKKIKILNSVGLKSIELKKEVLKEFSMI